LGIVVYSGTIDQDLKEIDLGYAQKGLYVLKVTSGKESFSKKIIIQ
jgi:hypothetical protein